MTRHYGLRNLRNLPTVKPRFKSDRYHLTLVSFITIEGKTWPCDCRVFSAIIEDEEGQREVIFSTFSYVSFQPNQLEIMIGLQKLMTITKLEG